MHTVYTMPVTSSVTLPSTFVFLQQIIKTNKKTLFKRKNGPIQFISKHKIICYRKDRIVAFYEKSNQTHMAKMFTSV